MTSPAAELTAPGIPGSTSSGPLVNRFHIAAVAFQRAKQLQNGARPRVDAAGHRPTRLAVLEVLADTISWTVV